MRATLLLALLLPACTETKDPGYSQDTDLPGDSGDTGTGEPRRVTILHTNDWQSHMLGFGPNAEYTPGSTGDDGTVGGLARLRAFVAEVRASAGHPVVLYDAGDWMAGDLFQLLATTHAAELTTMGLIDYDAITIGNHEFDWGPDVLGQMITIADASGVTVPIVASNIVPNPDDAGDDLLEAHFTSGRIESTRVQELDNGLRIGLFGVLGDDAQAITPAVVPAGFTPATEAAAEALAELQAQDVDLVVALSHSGVTDDPATSPDELLAAAVPGIDVVVGGHSHTALSEARVVGETVIVQAGALTQYVGELTLVEGTDGGWTVEAYTLHELDDTVAGDAEVTTAVDGYMSALASGPLVDLGYDFDAPMFAIPGDLPATGCVETGLGNLITDAFLAEMNRLDPEGDPIDFAFESQGVIRDSMNAGTSGVQGFSDVFRVLPLGFGTDDAPGYALVDFYVTASEVKDVCEVSASISPSYGCNYYIEVAGLRCTVEPDRAQFARARSVERLTPEGTWEPLDTSGTELYHVAVDSYVAGLMGILEDLTYGLIVITAKDAEGNPYAGTGDMLFDADPSTSEVEELKLWEALVGYGTSFSDTSGDGVPDLPESYLTPAGRIVEQ